MCAEETKQQSHQAKTQSNPVDMVAFAREATIRDQAGIYAGTTKVIAPAKVNLFLGVGEKRADGYHAVTNTMHTLMLHDVLYLRVKQVDPIAAQAEEDQLRAQAEGEGAAAQEAQQQLAERERAAKEGLPLVRVVTFGCEGVEPPAISSWQNLAYKAVMELARETGNGAGQAIDIRIEKHIPFQAGLGGGSSDAAAALAGAAKLWGIQPDSPVLGKVAARLGADVAFFLHGGCAQFGGVGEVFERALVPAKNSVVLIKPEGGLSTARIYESFDSTPYLPSEETLQQALGAEEAAGVPPFNGLQRAAEEAMPELEAVRTWAMAQPGARTALLCGSGSCTYVECESFESACSLAAAAMAKGWWARSTAFANLRAAVVPKN